MSGFSQKNFIELNPVADKGLGQELDVAVVAERENSEPARPGRWPKIGPGYWNWARFRGALTGKTSRLKMSKIGLDLEAAVCLNLLPPDRQGVPWNASAAASVAAGWRPRLAEFDEVYLVGGRVARAFGVRGPYSAMFGTDVGAAVFGIAGRRPLMVVVPHPSGLNLWWNDVGRVRRLRSCLRSVRRVARRRLARTSSPAGSPSA